MCYSAMVEQNFKSFERWKKARIDSGLFEGLFRRRVEDDSIKIARALEANYADPKTAQDKRITQYIKEYHARKTAEWQADLFKQKKRLADAERSLKTKETKKALEDQRIASNKIERYVARLADAERKQLKPEDSRIFPFWYVPVMVMEDGEYVIKPMRYHCRMNGKPASYDKRYPGLYNARRDNLDGYWKGVFGTHHAIALVSSFFENVALHDFEHRELRKGEKEQNLVLHFNPRTAEPMLLACVWDRWQKAGEDDLYSFAIVTDDPPPEVAATGHNRCPIPLKAANVDAWLTPEGRDKDELQALLDDHERPYYEHERAA
ncbi:MAG: SOS response-associated peptidase family protein [Acidiferrobacteraceae bacterium]|jgi:putative SOS response-associated peptidase YedK